MESEKSTDDIKSEELLLKELEKYPEKKLSKHDVYRVSQMVHEYQGKIKSYLYEQQEKKADRWDRIADKVAIAVGSWWFLIIFGSIIFAWTFINNERNSLFILSFALTILSFYQSTMIQMSQNRQATKDKQEQMLDIAINYKAEQENLEIQQHLLELEKRLHIMESSLTSINRNQRRTRHLPKSPRAKRSHRSK
ncbi:DUF1003 domain-containing protein [Paenibacillus sp. FJAT-26967]|uniref:DUF1003 domain-containing protein n=1 Tax=Paenibacillus sp. FJAT-26967 TaxID=1729690 RepID=UPI000839A7FE|nr:DUF1003 domain-containing protein [Paenibacillus sp. FJAT-26967]